MGVGERGEAPGCWSGDVPDTMRPAEKVVEVNRLDVGPVLRDKLTYGGGTTRDGEGTT